MKRELLDKSLITGKLQLTFWKFVDHYFIVVFALLIASAPIIRHTFFTSEPIDSGSITVSLIFGSVGILFIWLQSERLKFEQLNTKLERTEIDEIIENVAEQLEWIPIERTDQYIIAKTHPSVWSGSWGEQITILFDHNKVLVNSICDPDKRSSVVSFGRNKQNVSTLINALKKAEANRR